MPTAWDPIFKTVCDGKDPDRGFTNLCLGGLEGTAAATLFCSIFIPAAVEVGFNPASMAMRHSSQMPP